MSNALDATTDESVGRESDAATRSGGGIPLVPVLLLLLALLDLRIEIQLLLDRFTLTTLLAGLRNHWLAVTVLLLQPSLWRHYRRRPR